MSVFLRDYIVFAITSGLIVRAFDSVADRIARAVNIPCMLTALAILSSYTVKRQWAIALDKSFW